MAGATIPLTPAVHQMIDIGPVPRFADAKTLVEYPIVRDMDTNMYERQEGGGLEIGSYAHRPILLDADEIPSIEESALSPTELPFTQADFEPQLEQALELMPEIVGDESVGVKYAINGLLSVTLDGLPLLGETPEVRGLWSAAAVWIKEGPGVGKTVAELMVHGESEIDVYDSDIARAYPTSRPRPTSRPAPARASTRCTGSSIPPSSGSPTAASGCRRSTRASRRSAPSSTRRPAGSGRSGTRRTQPLLEEFGDRVTRRETEWEARWWSPIINAEHLAMRDRAGMIDLSAFCDLRRHRAGRARRRPAGRDAPDGRRRRPRRLHADPAAGRRLQGRPDDHAPRRATRFRVVTGGAWGMSDLKWFADHLPPDGSAQIADRTASLCTLGLWGPRARDILVERHQRRRLPRGLPVRDAARTIEVGSLQVLASRISYVGDLGWELYVPIEQGAKLWDIDRRGGRAARQRPGRHRRLRHDRAPGEGLPRLRRRARRRVRRRRGRDGLGQGQGRGLHRQGGARAPAGRGAGGDPAAR